MVMLKTVCRMKFRERHALIRACLFSPWAIPDLRSGVALISFEPKRRSALETRIPCIHATL